MASTAPAPNDWLAHPELLPPRPHTFTETKYLRLFAVDLAGRSNHDQYVFLAPNGLAVVGLAPSHPLIAAHRRATGYKPCPLQYVPPKLEHLDVHELAAAAVDEDAQEEGDGGADAGTAGAEGAPDGRPGEAGDGEAVGADADNGDAAGEAADEEAGGDAAAAGTSAGVGLPAADGAGALEGREAPQQGQGTAGPSGGGGAGGGGGGGGGTEMDGTSRAWRQRQMHVIE